MFAKLKPSYQGTRESDTSELRGTAVSVLRRSVSTSAMPDYRDAYAVCDLFIVQGVLVTVASKLFGLQSSEGTPSKYA